jgi:hypothetical protein
VNSDYHRSITVQALKALFVPPALEWIIAANLGQDSLRGQIGHDEYHFDSNAFEKSRTYLEHNRALARAALHARDVASARSAFGRLTHACQDFYAHSNYIALWLASFPSDALPSPAEVQPLDPKIMHHPGLRSGRLYYPLELLCFVPFLKEFILPLFPSDSHARMNLDSPQRGSLFPYAEAAAIKRTVHEYEQTISGLPEDWIAQFRNSM